MNEPLAKDQRLMRINTYLGMDRDELRELLVDRDEEIERLTIQLEAELKRRQDECND